MPEMKSMQSTSGQSKKPSLALRLSRPVAYAWLKAARFKVEGRMPDLPKYVIVAAPHTSNWDLPNALAAGIHYGVRVHWMGKDSIFKWPFGGLMRWLGGIAVERGRSTNAVGGMVETFKARNELFLIVAPAGTRSATVKWKSGFYHIAHGAAVPLVLAFIDYNRRAVGIAGVVTPTGDYDADLAKIQALYAAAAIGTPKAR
jgi:1-acyl-sn-glycerol-3-phosphate acyltransferase